MKVFHIRALNFFYNGLNFSNLLHPRNIFWRDHYYLFVSELSCIAFRLIIMGDKNNAMILIQRFGRFE